MTGRILVVDDEKSLVLALKGLLKKEGYEVDVAYSGEEAIAKIEPGTFHLVITDLSLGGKSGMDVLARAREVDPELAVVMITAYGSEKIAVEAMKAGAHDYIPKPFDNDEIRVVVRRVLDTVSLRRDHQLLLKKVQQAWGFEQLIGKSAAMQEIFSMIEKVADTDITVLVRGPSGTGKELVANAIHYRSPRRGRPMVKMNCAALSQELVESELFGHEKGSFTGAVARREGKFEAAAGGTLFLDEVGDMPLETQAKLLRAIQEKEFERVGGNQTIRVDVRIVAATNRDALEAVRTGKLREDLYYRLHVIPVALPPLRDRGADILLLAESFLARYSSEEGKTFDGFARDAEEWLVSNTWPGNVRELENLIRQVVVLNAGGEISRDQLPTHIAQAQPIAAPSAVADIPTPSADGNYPEPDYGLEPLWMTEKKAIERAIALCRGNVVAAAKQLQINPSTIYRKKASWGES